MTDFFGHPLLIAALWFAAILALTALAIMIVRRLRDVAADDREGASDLLSKFGEIHSRGGLSDDEYRTIKTKLATRLDAELNDNKQPDPDR